MDASFQLLPGDQIWSVNGEDVKNAPREHVITLVRACSNSVSLVVCQPPEQKGARKSTLLSASKRARLKNKPSRVRFAESVCVNGAPLFPVSYSSYSSCKSFIEILSSSIPAIGVFFGRFVRPSDGKRSQSVPGERADQIVQIRRLDDGPGRRVVPPIEAVSSSHGALQSRSRTYQIAQEEQANVAGSSGYLSAGKQKRGRMKNVANPW